MKTNNIASYKALEGVNCIYLHERTLCQSNQTQLNCGDWTIPLQENVGKVKMFSLRELVIAKIYKSRVECHWVSIQQQKLTKTASFDF
jgi:hypothetical protein